MSEPIDGSLCVIDNLKLIDDIILELRKELSSGGMYVTRQKGGSPKKNLIKILEFFKLKKKVACNYQIEPSEQKENIKEERSFAQNYNISNENVIHELVTVLATIVPETVKQLRELNKTVNKNLYPETKEILHRKYETTEQLQIGMQKIGMIQHVTLVFNKLLSIFNFFKTNTDLDYVMISNNDYKMFFRRQIEEIRVYFQNKNSGVMNVIPNLNENVFLNLKKIIISILRGDPLESMFNDNAQNLHIYSLESFHNIETVIYNIFFTTNEISLNVYTVSIWKQKLFRKIPILNNIFDVLEPVKNKIIQEFLDDINTGIAKLEITQDDVQKVVIKYKLGSRTQRNLFTIADIKYEIDTIHNEKPLITSDHIDDIVTNINEIKQTKEYAKTKSPNIDEIRTKLNALNIKLEKQKDELNKNLNKMRLKKIISKYNNSILKNIYVLTYRDIDESNIGCIATINKQTKTISIAETEENNILFELKFPDNSFDEKTSILIGIDLENLLVKNSMTKTDITDVKWIPNMELYKKITSTPIGWRGRGGSLVGKVRYR